MVVRRGDEVGADQAVSSPAADKEGARQDPKGSGFSSLPQYRDGGSNGRWWFFTLIGLAARAEGQQPNICGPLSKAEPKDWNHG